MLLKSDTSMIDVPNNIGRTALHLACQAVEATENRPELVTMILDAGASKDVVDRDLMSSV